MRRTYGRDPLYGLLLTFGIALVLEDLIRVIWGTRDYVLPVPRDISGGFLFLDLIWSRYRFWAAGFRGRDHRDRLGRGRAHALRRDGEGRRA